MMARRAWFVPLLAVLASALGMVPALAADPVRIATEGGFPPYNTRDAAGELTGFEIDLGNAICAHAGWQCEWVVADWSALIPGLLANDFDAIMAGMSITPARSRSVAFSRAYFPANEGAVGMFVGSTSFLVPETALIAVQSGTIHEEHLREHGLRVQPHATADAALDAVLDGKVDMVFGSPDFLELRVNRTSRSLAILGREDIAAGGAAIAVRPGDSDLLSTFNAALDALSADGTMDRLDQVWFKPGRDI